MTTARTEALRQVAPGVWRIEVPAPGSVLGSSLVYLISTPMGAVLIDSGDADKSSWQALKAGIEAAGLSADDVHTVLLTHAHYDHAGSAARLQAQAGSVVALHPAERAFLAEQRDVAGTAAHVDRICLRAGAPGELFEAAPQEPAFGQPSRSVLVPDIELSEGQRFEFGGDVTVEALSAPGHSPGHVAFAFPREGIVFGGDALFASGTPLVVLMDIDDTTDGTASADALTSSQLDPLGDLLSTLSKLESLAPSTLLPGHGGPISNVAERSQVVRTRLLSRKDEVLSAVSAGACSPWNVAERISWGRPWQDQSKRQQRPAILSVLAYLRALEADGAVLRDRTTDALRYEVSR